MEKWSAVAQVVAPIFSLSLSEGNRSAIMRLCAIHFLLLVL